MGFFMNIKKKSDDLSTIISFALKRQLESKKMKEKKDVILSRITDIIKSGNINYDEVIHYADSLLMTSEWEKAEKKITDSLESKFIALLIYRLLDDKEHINKLLEGFNSLLRQIINEALAWKNYDRAYLIQTFNILRDAILAGPDNLQIKEPEYLSHVHPYIRDLPSMLVSYLSSRKSIAGLKNAFERYEKFSAENNLMDIWEIIKKLVDLTCTYLRMKGAVTEKHDETAER